LGRSFREFVHADDVGTCQEFLEKATRTGLSQKGVECRARHCDGRWFWHITNGAPLKDKTGRYHEFVGIARGVTDRRQMEDALWKSNSQLNLLTTITRHGIRNRVWAIIAYLDLAGTDSPSPGMTECLEKITKVTMAIQAQITFTKRYQETGSPEPRWQELSKVISTLLLHMPDTVTLKSGVEGIFVYADLMLPDVFANLLDNSVLHGGNVTLVRISARRSGNGLVIVYEDNGTGVLEVEKEKIFELGYRKNTGLGLFLSRKVLATTGISIRETGEPGKGARFEITVPGGSYRTGPDQAAGERAG
jgi:signal transduction histidine kinase